MMCFPQAIGHRERWDNEIEADSTHEKLELGVYEAFEEKAKGALRDL
jgi:hypothetical protein